MLLQDDTPENDTSVKPYPKNPPINLLRSDQELSPKNFFSVEGIDGAGKTALLNALTERFQSRGLRVTVLRLSDSQITRHALKRAKWVNADPVTFNLLNWVSVFDQLTSLKDRLNTSEIFLFDRYTATIRIRGIIEGLSTGFMEILASYVPRPRRIFFVDCDPVICCERILMRDRPVTYFESGARDVECEGQMMLEQEPANRLDSGDVTAALLKRLRRMQKEYIDLLAHTPDVCRVDNSRDLMEAVQIVAKEIELVRSEP
jgi:thymidylate kinase